MNEDNKKIVENFSDLVDKIVVQYNRGIVLDFVTSNSFDIIEESIDNLQERFNTILSLFEEIQKESSSSAENAGKIDEMIGTVLEKRENVQREVHKRVEQIEATAANAQHAADAFTVLKDRTAEVKDMLSSIQEVSVKTGILAINASIEAARAGSFGSGFRIIANEVRSLATQTGDFAKNIQSKLDELSKSVSEINDSMSLFISLFSKFQSSFNGVLNNLDENSITLNKASDFLTEITSSIKEQDITIREGFYSLKKIDGLLRETGAILDVVQTSHEHLGTLLQQK
ncbi:methyl-accepting chemotaxis protein [Treponema pedis]|uniref:Methyl-accepting chemotaxis protein n=2 Tax=Treponema pedis TaxID=409322 RepID=S6A577_9SPIR|nr:methyl-accepting chemotaxis protein [Treponema pedis]AGT45131.1 methyl-accepting chemotaxis protein [Treponema pedis str. T A4]QOW60389.1 methyl-accepting chemotaxis protein [Treponema pedis]QSI05731.1 methyl-accepting chemotaxis protein [Treponema pedis]